MYSVGIFPMKFDVSQNKNLKNIAKKYILTLLLFIYVKDQYYNLRWSSNQINSSVQMTSYSWKITLTSQKWVECIYCLTLKQKALMLINFINSLICLSALSLVDDKILHCVCVCV